MRSRVILLPLLLALLLAAMAAKNLLVQPPPLRPRNLSGQFDAVRAKQRLTIILGDQRPHPADTGASDLVRTRLIAQLKQIGLKPIVRDQFVCNELYKQRGVSCARVRNVIAVLGPASGRALLLNAHYDSSPAGPGAADDGIGVATLLEAAANLKARKFDRPVILLFNEGEELGLIGARAFLADPLSRSVDSVVNLEARGVRGPVNMFETSRPNGVPIAVFGSTVKRPFANSLSTDVYRLLPNYTDVNSFAERGWLTLNLAPIGNETRYHSAGDEIDSLDLATLQHMGDQTLALAEALSRGAPRAVPTNRIFMDMAGWALLSLPIAVGAALLIGLLLAFVIISVQRRGLVVGATAIVGSIVASSLLAWLLVAAVGAVRNGMFWRAHPIWTHLAVYSASALAAIAAIALVGGKLDRTRLRPAYWLVFLVLGASIGLVAPGGIIFFIFPPLIASAGMLASHWWQAAERAASWLAIALLFVTWGAMLGLLEELLNGGPMWIFAPLGCLLILPVLIEARPLIVGAGFRSSVLVAGLVTLAALAASLAAPARSADRQQRFVIQQVTDVSRAKSWWSVLNDWSRLPDGFQGQWQRRELSFSERQRWIAKSPFDPSIKAPDIEVVSKTSAGNERRLILRLQANGNDHVDLVAPPDSKIRAAGVSGFVRPIDQAQGGKYYISCFGRNCDGATLLVAIGKLDPVQFTVLGGKAVLPPAAAPLIAARPRFARPQYNRDEAIAYRQRRL